MCGIQFDRNDILKNKLVVVTLEGNFHLFDLRTFNAKKGFASLTEKVFTVNSRWYEHQGPWNFVRLI